MAMDAQERVSINTDFQKDMVAGLCPGLLVVLYDEEMEVEGMVEFDAEHQIWLAQPNWSTRRDLPTPSSKVA
jgi:hypothetical protein